MKFFFMTTLRFSHATLTSLACCVFILSAEMLYAQAENVPATHAVYKFLDRMEVRGLLSNLHLSSLPVSRKLVAHGLEELSKKENELTTVDREDLARLRDEFAFDIMRMREDGSWKEHQRALVAQDDTLRMVSLRDMFSDKQKYLYAYSDSVTSLFLDGLAQTTMVFGDNAQRASLLSGGFRVRGTIGNNVGYFFEASNGVLTGDHDFAVRTVPELRGVQNLKVTKKFFDVTSGALTLDLDPLFLELGRERFFLGSGTTERLLIGNAAPAFDALRMKIIRGRVDYTFVYGKLPNAGVLGRDATKRDLSRFVAIHRVEVNVFDGLRLGFSEVAVHVRPAPDLSYLNPFNSYFATQLRDEARDDSLSGRDNSLMGADAEWFVTSGLHLYGSFLLDDLNPSYPGDDIINKYGYLIGARTMDPLGLKNISVKVEYMYARPFLYSHRDTLTAFASNDLPVGISMPPNADRITIDATYHPFRILTIGSTYYHQRHGDNIYHGDTLIANYGGRVEDVERRGLVSRIIPTTSGNRIITDRINVRAEIEPIPQYFITLSYDTVHDDSEMTGITTYSAALFGIKIDF